MDLAVRLAGQAQIEFTIENAATEINGGRLCRALEGDQFQAVHRGLRPAVGAGIEGDDTVRGRQRKELAIAGGALTSRREWRLARAEERVEADGSRLFERERSHVGDIDVELAQRDIDGRVEGVVEVGHVDAGDGHAGNLQVDPVGRRGRLLRGRALRFARGRDIGGVRRAKSHSHHLQAGRRARDVSLRRADLERRHGDQPAARLHPDAGGLYRLNPQQNALAGGIRELHIRQ